MKKNLNVVKTVMLVLLLIVAISGTTYAIFAWAVNSDDGLLQGTSECFAINYTKGADILNGELEFGSTYADGLSATVKVKLDDTCTMEKGNGTLYLNTDDITSDFLITNQIIRYQVLEDGVVVDGGSGKISQKGRTPIYENIEITSTEKSYTVYIWMSIEDANDSNFDDIMTSSYSGAIGLIAESR